MDGIYKLALTIAILNNSLITRLDFQYNSINTKYSARLWLDKGLIYDIKESGEVSIIEHKCNY